MHITLHITTGCNMRCDYCYSPPLKRLDMNEETAYQAVEYANKISDGNTGVIFFGGEPLLKKELIKSTINKCKKIEFNTGASFHYKVTTNGLLLSKDFLEYANSVGLVVALSIDGIQEANDKHRRMSNGSEAFAKIEGKAKILLNYQPYAMALVVVNPDTVEFYTDSVEYLYALGFRYLVVSLNYAGSWDDRALLSLKRQYKLLARMYEKMTLEERKFYFSPFEVKLASHIKGATALCNRCILGKRQVSVAPDGTIYPCVQFVKDGVSNKEFSIGDVWKGIDEEKRNNLYELSQKRNEICQVCALNERCNNDCSCLNWQSTGMINEVSPVLCEHERMLFPIVDKLGERLFRKKAPMFIQKHYNAIYPILSLMDDQSAF
jgi:uncharacterized protein